MSNEQVRSIDFILRKFVDSHRLDLVDVDEMRVFRDVEAALSFRLRTRPWVQTVKIHEQDLLLTRSGPALLELTTQALARGAAELRGVIFRDLLMSMNDYPVDFIGNEKNRDELIQRGERTAVRLMEAVKQLSEGK